MAPLTRSLHRSTPGGQDVAPVLEKVPTTNFFSLPYEIRLMIYRLVLEQPCKFDMRHLPSCPYSKDPYPSYFSRYYGNIMEDDPEYGHRCCETCGMMEIDSKYIVANRRPRLLDEIIIFRRQDMTIWAREAHPLELCYDCRSNTDGNLFQGQVAVISACKCTRRCGLGLLLVNRQINQEAGHLFWTANWFAFEDVAILIGFLSALRPGIHPLLQRISFLPDSQFLSIRRPRGLSFPRCCKLLRLCTGLKILQVDSIFQIYDCLKPTIWEMGVVESISFVTPRDDTASDDFDEECNYVYPAQAERVMCEDGCVKEYVKSLKVKSSPAKKVEDSHAESSP